VNICFPRELFTGNGVPVRIGFSIAEKRPLEQDERYRIDIHFWWVLCATNKTVYFASGILVVEVGCLTK
jgi:hypothetical protein